MQEVGTSFGPARLLAATTYNVQVYFGVNTDSISDTSAATVTAQANSSALVSNFLPIQLS